MVRRIIRLCMAGVLLLSIQLFVYAGGMGSIKISLKSGSTSISGAKIILHLAGNPTQGGYILTSGFGGGFVQEVDVLSPELAKWLAGKTVSGKESLTDRNGDAYFPDLEEGLYLVQQQMPAGGFTAFEPFLITLPWDGNIWDIHAAPKVDRMPAEVPDTSDPGTVIWGFYLMALSGSLILLWFSYYGFVVKNISAECKKARK